MDELINQWVNPFYRAILHGNYYYLLKADEQTLFNNDVKKGLSFINENIAIRLLSDGWREQLTGSWFSGLKGYSQFADLIGKKLVESKTTYAGQGLSFALACFANEKSVSYFIDYLNIYLPQQKLLYDQAWVMPALMWVDERNGTNHAEKFISSGGLWEKYISDKKSDIWLLSNCKASFWNLMKYCQMHFLKSEDG